jgi:hypothetical protein
VKTVITGATGTISKSYRKDLSYIPGKHEIKEPQKIAIFGTAHVLRKVVMQKYNRFDIGNSDICTVSSKHRMAATLYSLGTLFQVCNCKYPS